MSTLTNNKNRLKLKELIKKLSHYKHTLSLQQQQSELEFAKFKEQRISLASIINREIHKFQKQDEDALNRHFALLKTLTQQDQQLIIELENKFENQDIIQIDECVQQFLLLEQDILAVKPIEVKSLDFKLLTQQEYQQWILMSQDQKLKFKDENSELFRNEQKLNVMLSQQIEEKNAIINNLQEKLIDGSYEQLRDQLSQYDAFIEEQRQQLNVEVSSTFNFMSKTRSVFDHIHKILNNNTREIDIITDELRIQASQYQQAYEQLLEENKILNNHTQQLEHECFELRKYIDRLSVGCENVLVESKDQQNRLISQIKETSQQKIKLQDEVSNLLNTSIEIEKENQKNNSLTQNLKHQIKQLQKMNQQLYEDNQQSKQSIVQQNQDLMRVNQEYIALEGKYAHLEETKDIEIKQLQTIIGQYQQTIQNLQRVQTQTMKTEEDLDQSYQTQLQKVSQQKKQLESKFQFQIIEHQEEINNLNKLLQKKEIELSQQENEIGRLQRELEKAHGMTKLDRQKIKQLESEFINEQKNLEQSLRQKDETIWKFNSNDVKYMQEIRDWELKYNLLQEQIKQLETAKEHDKTITKQSDQANRDQIRSYEQLVEKYKKQLQENESKRENLNVELRKSEQIRIQLEEENAMLQKQLYGSETDFQSSYNKVQEELNEERYKSNHYSQELSELRHKLILASRQVEQMELTKNSELLSQKIEWEKSTFEQRKELEALRERFMALEENHEQTLYDMEQRNELVLQEVAMEYEKQIKEILDHQNMNKRHQKPPKMKQSPVGPGMTNSPASSMQQSFYREVAKFSKELDSSVESSARRVGLIKQNKHIFIEDGLEQSSYCSRGDQAIRFEVSVQTEEVCEDLFPPFDHRVCLRCKKNDMIAPNHCRFKEVTQINDLNNSQGSARKSSRVLKQHTYGSNMSWRQRSSFNKQYQSNSQAQFASQSVNTVITMNSQVLSHKNSKQIPSRTSQSLCLSLSSKQQSDRTN